MTAEAPATNRARPLPPGWRWARLRDLGDLTDGDWILNSDYAPSGVRLLQVGDVGLGGFTPKSNRYITRERAEELNCTFLCPGDVLISRMPDPIGRACLLPDLGYQCITAVDVSIWRPTPDFVDPTYAVFALTTEDHLDAAKALASGATRPRISRAKLELIPIPVPPLPEQRRIAAILRKQMDAVRRAREAALARLEAARALPAAFLRAVFESEDAKRWPQVRIGEMCTIIATQVSPTLPQFRDLPHVSGENIESGTGRLMETRSAVEDRMISGKYLFETGDVLYSKLRPYLRKVALAPFTGVCSADMYPLRPAADVSPAWLAGVLLSEPFSRYANEESKRVRMPKLNRDQLFAWVAPKPVIETQVRLSHKIFDGIVSAISTTALVESELATIDALPRSLLRRAFAGEV